MLALRFQMGNDVGAGDSCPCHLGKSLLLRFCRKVAVSFPLTSPPWLSKVLSSLESDLCPSVSLKPVPVFSFLALPRSHPSRVLLHQKPLPRSLAPGRHLAIFAAALTLTLRFNT